MAVGKDQRGDRANDFKTFFNRFNVVPHINPKVPTSRPCMTPLLSLQQCRAGEERAMKALSHKGCRF
ncbi:hypothetical protein EXN66_Car013151 [Channa argus]|uniref:Uncharacterized protein n=1 Tax=Channa argus TaxID=215402 RepID=A0A6G1Q4C6_CHAAH|nr:hypothetical protein EXN66_Car013151 [Channa argus]